MLNRGCAIIFRSVFVISSVFTEIAKSFVKVPNVIISVVKPDLVKNGAK